MNWASFWAIFFTHSSGHTDWLRLAWICPTFYATRKIWNIPPRNHSRCLIFIFSLSGSANHGSHCSSKLSTTFEAEKEAKKMIGNRDSGPDRSFFCLLRWLEYIVKTRGRKKTWPIKRRYLLSRYISRRKITALWHLIKYWVSWKKLRHAIVIFFRPTDRRERPPKHVFSLTIRQKYVLERTNQSVFLKPPKPSEE
jgi:hypothetical protein